MFVLFVMRSYLIEVRGLKLKWNPSNLNLLVVSYRGTWVETLNRAAVRADLTVVSYRGTWIET